MNLRGKKTGKKIALCLGDGCGLGNMLQALPAVQALHELGNACDLFLSGFMYAGIADAVRGQPYVRDIYENTYVSREEAYDVCIVSFLSDHRVDNAKKYLQAHAGLGEAFGIRAVLPGRGKAGSEGI